MLYTLRVFLFKMHVFFIILAYLVPVLFKFCMQSVLKLKKNNSGSKSLNKILSFDPEYRYCEYIF